jgi:hypothetical protein
MGQLCVATDSSRAYYLIASRLRRAHMNFRSVVPGEAAIGDCDLVLTTRQEAGRFADDDVLAIEDLDENPLVMKAQVLTRVDGAGRDLVIGIDPGSRIGLAIFYAGAGLGFHTFNSRASLYKTIFGLVRRVPNSRCIVKIGNGSRELASKLASDIGRTLTGVTIEIVNEEGTSARSVRFRSLPKDQSAAARIAFRKGAPYMVT